MNTRFFTNRELDELYQDRGLPPDLDSGQTIGVTEASACANLVEYYKLNGSAHERSFVNLELLSKAIDDGNLWVLELNAEQLSNAMLDNDFFLDHCDKADNPYTLSKRIALRVSEYSHWSHDIYLEAF